jgi:hypothetical protein
MLKIWSFRPPWRTHSKGLRAKMGILRIQGGKRPKKSPSLSAQERLIEIINADGLAAGKA